MTMIQFLWTSIQNKLPNLFQQPKLIPTRTNSLKAESPCALVEHARAAVVQ